MAGIASVPERETSLRHAVESIAPQVDKVYVSLNGYQDYPSFLENTDNVIARFRNGDNGGDAEKFAEVDEWDGLVVTCDDDLLYPHDYVARLVDGLDRHGHDRVVGFHGGKTLGWNGAHKAATHKTIRCLGRLAEDDTDVNVLGTGALAFHTDHIPVWRDLFRTPNMADVYLAGHAHDFAIPMVALAHDAGWIHDITPEGAATIYDSNRTRDGSVRDTRGAREREMRRHNWRAPTSRPRVRVSIATCERPHLLPDLLRDLEREAGWVDLDVAVFDDWSRADYAEAKAICDRHGWEWLRTHRRLGKTGHHQLVTAELEHCKTAAADWFVFLPDDVRLVRHAIPRALELWGRLEEPSALTLWRLRDHEGQMNWTGRFPVEHEYAFEVFHVDGIYLCQRPTLEALSYRCPPLPALNRRRSTSSGVGRSMSLHLFGKGKRMYRVPQSLAVPVKGEPSVMNPDVGDRRYAGVAL